jgi:hypothetical protein
MAKKGIDINLNTVLIAGTAIFGILVVRRVLIKVGVLEGRGGTNVQKELTNPNSPWKPAFWISAPAGAFLLRRSVAESFAKKIHDSFTLTQDDFNQIQSVFSQLTTKSQVSFLADVFSQVYGEDLLSFLGDGGGILPWDGLNDSNLAKITDLVSRLPQYKTR